MDWFYTYKGEQQGPVSEQELRQLASSGQLQPTDLVWKQGLPEWTPVSAVLYGSSVTTPNSGPTTPGSWSHSGSQSYPPWSQPLTLQKKSGGKGWLIGIGVVVLLLIAGGVVYYFVKPNGGGKGGGEDKYSFDLRNGQSKSFTVEFEKDKWVKLIASSSNEAKFRLDVYVDNATLTRESRNGECEVDFVPDRKKKYRVRVTGMEFGEKAKGKVKWEIGSRDDLIAKARRAPLDINDQMTINDPILQRPKSALWNHFKVYDVHLEGNRRYVIRMKSIPLDCYLYVHDLSGRQLAFNDDEITFPLTLNSRIRFQPPRSGVYRIIATTLRLRETGPFTLHIHEDNRP